MEPLLVFPDTAPADLVAGLERAGYEVRTASDERVVAAIEPADGWAGAVVWAVEERERAFALCRGLRKRDDPVHPVLVVVTRRQLGELDLREDIFDDFCLDSGDNVELDTRLRCLLRRTGRGARPELVEQGALVMNLQTYQATVEGRPLDLTFMEYELLKFLASHPGRVFSRETLLSRVWGYEYYGGARTVDVHVRRLRAKLGEEFAHFIDTVRSVGYRFDSTREHAGEASPY